MIKALKQLSLQELDRLANRIETDPDNVAIWLFPDQPQNRSHLTAQIGKWAMVQKLVLESTAGDMPHIAIVFEKVAYRIWQRMPESARLLEIEFD